MILVILTIVYFIISQQTLQMLDQANESQPRSDTIILQLIQQLERANLQIEDMRQPKTVWQRFKAAFAS